jgi:preprotein translocase subunit SecD
MKTIINFFIVSIIATILTSGIINNPENKKTVLLQATNKNASVALLEESSKIISGRLKSYGLASFDCNIIKEKAQIEIRFPGNPEIKEIEGLLMSKGDLSFYETGIPYGLNDYLKNDQRFNPREARIGCAASENPDMIAKVQEYLKAKKLISKYKLLWGVKDDKSQICLYALKTNDGKPVMGRSDIETVSASQDKNSQSFLIGIKFKQSSASTWENATRENLNKPIAIVLDDKVLYDPVVRTVIQNGLCEISGNMSEKDVKYFLSIASNGQIPLNFELIK